MNLQEVLNEARKESLRQNPPMHLNIPVWVRTGGMLINRDALPWYQPHSYYNVIEDMGLEPSDYGIYRKHGEYDLLCITKVPESKLQETVKDWESFNTFFTSNKIPITERECDNILFERLPENGLSIWYIIKPKESEPLPWVNFWEVFE
jgi:hypothetical protein